MEYNDFYVKLEPKKKYKLKVKKIMESLEIGKDTFIELANCSTCRFCKSDDDCDCEYCYNDIPYTCSFHNKKIPYGYPNDYICSYYSG